MLDRTAGRVWTTEGSGDTGNSPNSSEEAQSAETPVEEAEVSPEPTSPPHVPETAVPEPAESETEAPEPGDLEEEAAPAPAEEEVEDQEQARDPVEEAPAAADAAPEREAVESEPESPVEEPASTAPEPASVPDSPADSDPPVGSLETGSGEKRRVLVVFPTASTGRLIRETLENFTAAEIDTTPDTIYGFELALKRRYHLFIFGLVLPHIDGPLLYELVNKTHPYCHDGARRTAPGVVFLREESDPRPSEELFRDPRVKGVLTKPLSIERLLQSVEGALERRAPI